LEDLFQRRDESREIAFRILPNQCFVPVMDGEGGKLYREVLRMQDVMWIRIWIDSPTFDMLLDHKNMNLVSPRCIDASMRDDNITFLVNHPDAVICLG